MDRSRSILEKEEMKISRSLCGQILELLEIALCTEQEADRNGSWKWESGYFESLRCSVKRQRRLPERA